jgi:thiol-disulfide isomerase/thioredoxin
MRLPIPFIISLLLCSFILRAQAPAVVVFDSFEAFKSKIDAEKSPVIVINFWATWCGPCVKELPYFEELNSKYAANGVKVILVSMDLPTQKDQRLIPFLEKNKINSEVVILGDQDADTWIPRMHENWDGSLPATFILKDGKNTPHFSDFESFGELEALLLPFLKAGTQAPTASRQR